MVINTMAVDSKCVELIVVVVVVVGMAMTNDTMITTTILHIRMINMEVKMIENTEEVPIYKITVTEIEREEDVVQVEDVVIVTIKTGDIMTMTRIDTGIMTLKTMDIRVSRSRSRSRSSHTVIHEEAKENH